MTENAADQARDRLDILAGVWDTTITMLDPEGNEGAVSKAVDRYDWMPGGFFLRHDVDAEMEGQLLQSMEIIALARDGEGYQTRSYDPDGTINDFSARLDGRQWRIVGAVQRFAGVFSADGAELSGEWEQKGGETWRRLMRVDLKKRPDAAPQSLGNPARRHNIATDIEPKSS